MYPEGKKIREEFPYEYALITSLLIVFIPFVFYFLLFLVLTLIFNENYLIFSPFILVLIVIWAVPTILIQISRTRKWYYVNDGYIIIRYYFRWGLLAKGVLIYPDSIRSIEYHEKMPLKHPFMLKGHFSDTYSTRSIDDVYVVEYRKRFGDRRTRRYGKGLTERTLREFTGSRIVIPGEVIHRYDTLYGIRSLR